MKNLKFCLFLLSTVLALSFTSCNLSTEQQESDSGITKATVKVATDASGHSIEQNNIMERLKRDNNVGSIKHLYIISSYTGDVLEYSTVMGKVTSGNKRLSPKTVNSGQGISQPGINWNSVKINNMTYSTDEVLDDGGAYGDSGNYMFWFDAFGNYHQYYPAGGTYVTISDKPMRIHKTNLSLSMDKNDTVPLTKEEAQTLIKSQINPGNN